MKHVKRIFALLLAAALLLTATGCSASDYKKATELLNAGNYADAEAMFLALGDYKDSADLVLKCRYGFADAAEAGGDYAAAAEQFKALGDYEDSAARASACGYALAEAALDDGDLDTAEERFTALGDYEDSAARASACGYALAEAALDDGDLDTAEERFTALGDYEDSAARAAGIQDLRLATQLTGLWASEPIDITDSMETSLYASLNPDVADEILDGVDLGTLTMEMTLEFTDNGVFYLKVDGSSLGDAVDVTLSVLRSALLQYFEETTRQSAEAEGMTLEQVMEAANCETLEDLFAFGAGMTFDDFIEESFPREFYLSAFDAVSMSGSFTVADGEIQLTLVGETDTVDYDADADTVTMDGGTENELVFHRS